MREIAEIKSGRGFKGGVQVQNEGTYVVAMGDVTGEHQEIDWREVRRSEVSVRTHKLLQNGDILFLAKGKQYKAVMVSGLEGEAVAMHQFFVITPGDKVDSQFLVMMLNSASAQEYFAAKARGEAKKHITKSDLSEFEVPTPEVSYQNQISTVMREVDETLKTIQGQCFQLHAATDKLLHGRLDESEDVLTDLLRDDDNHFHHQTEQLHALLKLERLGDIEVTGRRKPRISI